MSSIGYFPTFGRTHPGVAVSRLQQRRLLHYYVPTTLSRLHAVKFFRSRRRVAPQATRAVGGHYHINIQLFVAFGRHHIVLPHRGQPSSVCTCHDLKPLGRNYG